MDEQILCRETSLGIPEAEKTLRIALEKFPQDALILYNLSCYLAKGGQMDEAKELLGKAIRIDPSFKELALEDEDLVGVWL